MPGGTRRVAVVHDFLYTYAGAERVLEQILQVYPDADLFSLFNALPEDQRAFIQHKEVKCSFLQKMPFISTRHRQYLPLMPLAVEQLDVSEYDLVITSSYLAAKGVITRPDQFHVCYCHSPVRFAWDLQHQYLAESGLARGIKSLIARVILHYIRNWDTRSANGVDLFLTNSRFVGRRIQKIYRRGSTTLYPPVDVESFTPGAEKADFYLTASRMVPYKRMDMIVEAFSHLPDQKLVVIGDGPEFNKIKAKAGANVTLLGYQSAEVLRDHMRRAKAFVFAAEEDFGIAPVEAMASGTPVIAYGRGGVTESVRDGVTGLFFEQQSPQGLAEAVRRFEARSEPWDAALIRRRAERFGAPRFREQFRALVETEWTMFRNHRLEPAAEREWDLPAGGAAAMPTTRMSVAGGM